MTDRAFDALLVRLVVAVERLAGIDQPKTVEGPAEKPKAIPMKDRVTVIDRRRPEPEPDLGTLTSGGKGPRRFFSESDPDAAAMKRPARGMGRPLR